MSEPLARLLAHVVMITGLVLLHGAVALVAVIIALVKRRRNAARKAASPAAIPPRRPSE